MGGAASRSVVSAVAASGWYQWHAALFCAVSVTARTARKKKDPATVYYCGVRLSHLRCLYIQKGVSFSLSHEKSCPPLDDGRWEDMYVERVDRTKLFPCTALKQLYTSTLLRIFLNI